MTSRFHGVQMNNKCFWLFRHALALPLWQGELDCCSRMAYDHQGPMQMIMYWNEDEILWEDIDIFCPFFYDIVASKSLLLASSQWVKRIYQCFCLLWNIAWSLIWQFLVEKGIKKVSVACPSFTADCLETLEEIAVENHEDFQKNGGDHWCAERCRVINRAYPLVRLQDKSRWVGGEGGFVIPTSD